MAFIPNNVYILYNLTSGTVLDLDNGGTANGTRCQGQWENVGNNICTFNQQWHITSVPGLNDVFNLCNLRSRTYLDLDNGSNVNHTKVQGWTKMTSPSWIKNQQWRIFADPKGGYRLQNVASSTYLDLDNGDNVNGTKVQGFQYVDTSNQRWDLRRVSRTGSEIKAMTIHSQTMTFIPNNIYILYNLTSGTVLDLDNGGTANGTQCQGWVNLGDSICTFNQQWLITSIPGLNGVFNLSNFRSGTYLDLDNGSNVNHTKVQGWTKMTFPWWIKNQQWRIFADPKGGYRLQNVASSTYLDLDNGNNVDGTKVQGFQYVDTSNQRWDLRRVSLTGSEIKAMTIHSQTMAIPNNVDTSKVSRSTGSDMQPTTIHSQTTAFNPNNVYILCNLTSGTVLDLDQRGTADGAQCQGWVNLGDSIYTFNQQWLITSVPGLNGIFNLCNLSSGTYLDLDNGSNVNHTKVQGRTKVTSPRYVRNQQWKIFTDPKGGYRLQNVASSTYLDLDNGNNVNGTKVQGLQYVDTSNQRWELRRVSRTGLEIQALVKANPFTSSDFGSYVQDGLYIVLPGSVRNEIYSSTGLSTTKWRNQIFDCDNFAFAAKAAIAKWGNDNIRADGLAILFGVMFGRNASGANAYNWYLTANLSGVIFFEPQNGNEMVNPGYTGYFGVF